MPNWIEFRDNISIVNNKNLREPMIKSLIKWVKNEVTNWQMAPSGTKPLPTKPRPNVTPAGRNSQTVTRETNVGQGCE